MPSLEISRNPNTKGVICKVWDVKNNKGNDGKTDLLDSLQYIEDLDKVKITLRDLDPEVYKSIDYATNNLKTLDGALVGCYLISDINKAADEMTSVKLAYGKTDGRTAVHGVISLDNSESDIANAGKLMSMAREVLQELFPNHQFVIAVHTNTDNLHIHFIVNSVSMDGKKIHRDNNFFRDKLQPVVNDKAIKYGFTPNARWLERKDPDKLTFPERKAELRRDIDEAIEKSNSFGEFIEILKSMEYVVNLGKHLSLQNGYMEKPIRTHQLGDRYTIKAITDRIATRLNDLEYLQAINHTESPEMENKYFGISRLPKYKDMNPEQRKEAIKLLKEGRNPWQEHYIRSWQQKRLNEDVQLKSNVGNIVRAYSSSGNRIDAMNEIINRQKEISEEKKQINANLKKYKPLKDIYFQLRKYEMRAYLYEFCGESEYANEYAAYKDLVDRLREGYGKTVEEVADFFEDQQNQLMYLDAQRKELNSEYRTIKRYATKDIYLARKEGIELNLGEISKYYDDVLLADKTGVTNAETKYIASKDGNYVVRMVKAPYLDEKGNPKQDIQFVVLDRYGVIQDEISLRNSDNLKDFSDRVNNITRAFNLNNCYSFNSYHEACKILGPEESEEVIEVTVKASTEKPSMKAFMSAVNDLSKNHETGIHYFANKVASEYIAKVETTDKGIKVYAIDHNKKVVGLIDVPNLADRNPKGFKTLVAFRDKYGFSDELEIAATEEDLEKNQIKKADKEHNANQHVIIREVR